MMEFFRLFEEILVKSKKQKKDLYNIELGDNKFVMRQSNYQHWLSIFKEAY
jgi:hypothetical protein